MFRATWKQMVSCNSTRAVLLWVYSILAAYFYVASQPAPLTRPPSCMVTREVQKKPIQKEHTAHTLYLSYEIETAWRFQSATVFINSKMSLETIRGDDKRCVAPPRGQFTTILLWGKEWETKWNKAERRLTNEPRYFAELRVYVCLTVTPSSTSSSWHATWRTYHWRHDVMTRSTDLLK